MSCRLVFLFFFPHQKRDVSRTRYITAIVYWSSSHMPGIADSHAKTILRIYRIKRNHKNSAIAYRSGKVLVIERYRHVLLAPPCRALVVSNASLAPILYFLWTQSMCKWMWFSSVWDGLFCSLCGHTIQLELLSISLPVHLLSKLVQGQENSIISPA
jgi:hypothetical protein